MSDVKVPEMGESIVEGTIIKWHVKQGDTVTDGQLLAELETDKVNIEIAAEQAGVISSILHQEGDTVSVGEAIAQIGDSGSVNGNVEAKEVNRSEQEPVAPSAPIASSEATAPSAPQAETAQQQRQTAVNDQALSPIASPAARKLARDRGIDLTQITPNDPIGRISEQEVRAHSEKSQQEPVKPASTANSASARPQAPAIGTNANASASGATQSGSDNKPIERRKMSRRRITIANRLVEAQRTAAMLTTFNEVDMTAILDIRKRRKQAFQEKHDVGLGFMSFFTKAVIGALKAFPLLNAEIQGDEIVVKNYYDIGIAVSAKEGLVVPVVRDADRLSFAGIEKQIGQLAEKARSNTLALSDLQGGTFTITNGGVFGSLLSTPILNAPQVGILGMHKIQLRPVAIDEHTTVNRQMMYVALSYDHRIVDGAEAVRFLVTLKQLLEDPESLLLEG
jgi:2-oxoglutarate dehydrogenase E2 component (dihydrolipoamide succinyltransferase)